MHIDIENLRKKTLSILDNYVHPIKKSNALYGITDRPTFPPKVLKKLIERRTDGHFKSYINITIKIIVLNTR